MKAKIIGIKSSEGEYEGRPYKSIKYHVAVENDTLDEGMEANVASWNALKRGAPPTTKLGDMITVSYDKYGKLLVEA